MLSSRHISPQKAALMVKRLWHAMTWQEIKATEYGEVFEKFGGSIDVHPLAIRLVESITNHRARYFGLRKQNTLIAAMPLWNSRASSTRRIVRLRDLCEQIDLGEGELILPIAAGETVFMPFCTDGLSETHSCDISNACMETQLPLMLAREHTNGPHKLSGKFLYNQRTQYKRFCAAGGRVQDASELSGEILADVYRKLFYVRWNKLPQGSELLPTAFGALKNLLGGLILWYEEKPIAVDLLYRYPTPRGLLAVGVNGGTDPAHKAFSPGSILHYLNGMNLEQEANMRSLPLRYSFGRKDANYKDLWCRESPTYHTKPVDF